MSTRRELQVNKYSPKTTNAVRGKNGQKKQRPLLVELYDILPIRWKGITFGLLLSLVPSYLISVTAVGDQKMLAIVPLLAFITTGYVVGIVLENNSES